MTQKSKQVCPTCQGEKVVKGTCECNMEWRGSQIDDEWEDCRCMPELECPTCLGSGYVSSDK